MNTASFIDTIMRSNEINLKFIKKNKSESLYDVKHCNLDKSLVQNFKEKFSNILSGYDNYNVSDYNINSYDKRNDIFCIGAKEIPHFALIYKKINEETSNALSFKQLNELSPNFFAVRFDYQNQDINKEIIIFNRQNPNTGLSKKTNIFWDGTRFVHSNASFFLRTDIDCFYDSETAKMYIINRKFFEDIFNFKSYYVEKAIRCIEKINAQNIITNINAFKEICLNDSNIVFRLAKIELSDDLIDVKNHLKEIDSIIKEDNLNIYFTGDNKIVIDSNTPKDIIRDILGLINDEYLTSRITKKNYVATTKQLSMLHALYSTV